MRILTGLSIAALLATAAPAFAQAATETPAAPAPEAPAAAAPAVPATPVPEGVTPEADKLLWCGHALNFASGFAKEAGDEDGAKTMLENGGKLIEQGSTLLKDLAPEKLEAAKSVYVEQIKLELAGTGENAKFTYDECMTLVQ